MARTAAVKRCSRHARACLNDPVAAEDERRKQYAAVSFRFGLVAILTDHSMHESAEVEVSPPSHGMSTRVSLTALSSAAPTEIAHASAMHKVTDC